MVGPQFDPYCLHHPVLGFGPSQVIWGFVHGNRGFLASGVSLNLSLLDNEPAFAGLSLRGKFLFPARSGDRFYDWMMGLQFNLTPPPSLGLRSSSPEAGIGGASDHVRGHSGDFRASVIRDVRDGVEAIPD
jgi:hypothetical protein